MRDRWKGALCALVLAMAGSPALGQSWGVVQRTTSPLVTQPGTIASDGTQFVLSANGGDRVPVFTLQAGQWVSTGQLAAPIAYPAFATSVAIDGEWAATASAVTFFSGLAMYRRSGLQWSLYEEPAAHPNATRTFGSEMVLDGTTWALGDRQVVIAPFGNVGVVWIYEFDGSSWIQTQMLRPSGFDTRFGQFLSMEGDRLASYAMFDGTGHVYVYERDGAGLWIQRARLPRPYYVVSGADVDIAGDRMILGIQGNSTTGQPGDAFVYERIDGTWTEVATLPDPLQDPSSVFAKCVAIDGDRALVGSYGGTNTRGTLYVYERSAGTWSLVDTLDAEPGQYLAYDLTMKGSQVLTVSPWSKKVTALDFIASAVPRNGSGVNASCYSSSVPILGSTWVAQVDVQGHSGANLTVIRGTPSPDPGTMTSYGELLVAGPRVFQSVAFPFLGVGTHQASLPPDPALSGLFAATQAVILGGGPGPELCNAVDLALGF